MMLPGCQIPKYGNITWQAKSCNMPLAVFFVATERSRRFTIIAAVLTKLKRQTTGMI
jgi:hypothetical protein